MIEPAMKSGLLLSSIITIWIVATIVTISMFLPDIKTTMQTLQSINTDSTFIIDGSNADDVISTQEVITNYSPLGVLDTLGL